MIVYFTVTLTLLCLAEATGRWIRKHRCWYCGVLYRHEDHCPFGMIR